MKMHSRDARIGERAGEDAGNADDLVRLRGVTKLFQLRGGLFDTSRPDTKQVVRAVAETNLNIRRGESLGLVGQSGSGKSTLGMMLAMLESPTSGTIEFDGVNLANARGAARKSLRRQIQIVFQDPYESLSPRYSIEESLTEPLYIHKIGRSAEERREIARLKLELAGLRPAERYLGRYPHELSGGERQRVAIARAILCEPRFIVADEPVSMLDVSVRAGLLNLLRRLRDEMQITYLFITHDLAVARYMCDRIAIMVHGHIVEIGPVDSVLQNPQHDYTRLLISAVPHSDPTVARASAQRTSEAIPFFHSEPSATLREIAQDHFVLSTS